MFKRLAVVVRAWATRRLLWVWLFAYACVMTSGYFWPVSSKGTYFECPSWVLPRNVRPTAPRGAKGQELPVPPGHDDLVGPPNSRDLVVKGPISDVSRLRAIVPRHWPELEQIFVGGYQDDPAGFRRVCEALPGIRVWHLDLNGGRLASTVFLLFVTLLLGGAVMQQATATFSLPQARLYPRFVLPHSIPPLAICVAGIATASFISRRYGTNFWAAASVQVLAWGIWGALEFLSVSLRQSRSGPQGVARSQTVAARGRWVEWAALILAIIAIYSIYVAHPYVLESFLLGELPWLSMGLFTLGAALGISAIVPAPKLSVALNEAGIAPVLSMQDIEKRRPSLSSWTLPVRGRLGHLRRPNRAPTWWWRIHAIQLGNPNLIGLVLIRIVGPAAVVAVSGRFFALQIFSRVFVILLVNIGWIVALSTYFSIWWHRRKAFSVELLYPWTRKQLTLSVFAAYAMDAVGSLAVLFATVIACDITLAWRLGADAIFRGALIAVCAVSILVTGGLWLLTLRHRLLASFLAFGGVVLLIAPLSFQWQTLTWMDMRYFLSVGVLPYAAAASLLGVDAYRRWMRSEWGLNES